MLCRIPVSLLVTLLLGAAAWADDPRPKVTPDIGPSSVTGPIFVYPILNKDKIEPIPDPKVDAENAIKLVYGELYIIGSPKDFRIDEQNYKGLLSITKYKGPKTFEDNYFVGGSELETKTFDYPYIAKIRVKDKKASGYPRLTLISLPVDSEGGDSKSKIDYLTFAVGGGVGPPTPPGPPKPPVDPPVVKSTKFRVVVVKDVGEWSPANNATLINPALNAYMKEKGHTWRETSINAKGADGQPPADLKMILKLATGKDLPQIFLVDESGDSRYQGTFPSGPNAAAYIKELMQTHGG